MKKLFFLYFTALLLLSNNIAKSINDATLPSLEAEYGEWKVFTIEQDNRLVCYATTTPQDMSGNHKDDREPYIMVTFFGSIRQEVSIATGYFYRPHSIVSVSIDGKQERFIAESDTIAWVEKNGTDKKVIQEMLGGFKFLVFAESNAMTYSVDTYSLSGFKKAYNKIKELCSNS